MTTEPESRSAHLLHESYLVSLGIQATIGASQLVGAVLLLVAEQTGWMKHLAQITGHDLARAAPDPFAHALIQALHDFSVNRETFWSIYLFGHGVLNLSVVVALLAKKPWAHPASMAVLTGFVIYQLERFWLTHAPVLVALSLFDLVVIALVWREWRVTRAARQG